ncbi:ArsR/SmtB family transcription factor [Phenylobacterium sp.]|jgi:DNA-binding transcriptional ArsR family regulator|uniref:ArsR/SmtB family transcription factor n=1 Tax=Phenylobacterium sp. TaxID=1871053 RepID=UPI002F40EC44
MTAAAISKFDGAAGFGPTARPDRLNAADPALRAFVALQRRRGVSWDGLARMLGRPGADVRAAFEPAPAAATGAAPPIAAGAPPRPPAAGPPQGRVNLGPGRLRVLQALADGARRRPEVAAASGVSETMISQHMTCLLAAGLVTLLGYGVWQASPQGLRTLRTAARAAAKAPPRVKRQTPRTQVLAALAAGARTPPHGRRGLRSPVHPHRHGTGALSPAPRRAGRAGRPVVGADRGGAGGA